MSLEDARKAGTAIGMGFTTETREEILDRLVAGETVAEICKEPEMPAERTLLAWIRRNQTFYKLPPPPDHTRSDADVMEDGGLGFRDRLNARLKGDVVLDLIAAGHAVKDTSEDYVMTPEGKRGNPTAVARHRLQADFALKRAERLDAKYAPRQRLSTEDEDGTVRPIVMIPAKVPVDADD